MSDDARAVRPPSPSPPATDPALGGPLLISPPGGTGVVVVTDALQTHIENLDRVRDALALDAAALDRIDALGAGSVPGGGGAAGAGVVGGAGAGAALAAAARGAAQVDAARAIVRRAEVLASRAAADLRQAVAAYTGAEQQQRERAQRLGSSIAQLWGPGLRSAIIAAIPALLIARRLGLGADDVPIHDLRQWLLDNPALITDPAFVEAVRAGVMSVDDAAGAAAGLPPGAMEGLAAVPGFTGVAAGAAITMLAGGTLGMFRETPVSLERLATTPTASPPAGAVERLARVPEGNQVRIERYDAPGAEPRYVVYVGPTETFSPYATDEPWDLTSNVAGVAGLGAGSVRATELAMHDAGIRAGDPVQFVGFSQGGLVATRLAADGRWDVAGLETYGAPAGNIPLPAGLAGMAVRNTDDFIPALAGPQLDHHLLQVERRAFADGVVIPTAEPAPAHQREAYVATATVIDGARSAAVREQVAAMDAFTSDYTRREGSSITVTTYHAERGGEKVLTTSGGSIP